MTVKCTPPLAIECSYPADEAVRIDAAFLPTTPDLHPLCGLHLVLLRSTGFDIQLTTGHERDVALQTVRPMVVGGVPIDETESELRYAWGDR